MLSKERRTQLIKEFGTTATDTGSPEVQVALLTERIKYLTEHFKSHPKDHHSRRGLRSLVSQRSRLLKYLQSESAARYSKLCDRLGLKKDTLG